MSWHFSGSPVLCYVRGSPYDPALCGRRPRTRHGWLPHASVGTERFCPVCVEERRAEVAETMPHPGVMA